MRLITTLAATVLATAALFAVGCGDDDDNSGSAGKATPVTTETSTATETTPAEETPATGDSVAISMKNIQFDPKEQTVKVGTKVTWTNDDSVAHNVVATEGAEFESDNFGQGGTYEFTPESAGTIQYTCTLHPGMDGTLEVTN